MDEITGRPARGTSVERAAHVEQPWLGAPSALVSNSRSELRRGWRLVLGCTLGGTIGLPALPNAIVAILMRDLEADLGWSRAALSIAPTILFATLVLTAPLAGWITDRVNELRVVIVSLVLISGGMFALTLLGPDHLWLVYLTYVSFGIVGAGVTPLTFAKIISRHFFKARGLALGCAMIGTALSGVWLSFILLPASEAFGWRSALAGVSLLMLLTTPVVGMCLRTGRRPTERAQESVPRVAAQDGLSFAEALGHRAFWLLAVAFMAISLAVMGFGIHYVSLMRDWGMPAHEAATLLGLGALFTVGARLVAGWLLDLYFAPHVAAVLMAAGALCFVPVLAFGPAAAVFGGLAVACAAGAESDLIGYLAGRYFGMRAYGRCYGVLYAFVLIGSTLSPVAYGFVFDHNGTYAPAILGSTILLVLSAGLMLLLPPFPSSYAAGEPSRSHA